MGACIGVCQYTVFPRTQTLYTAFNDNHLTKTLEKCWDQLDWLNSGTEYGFKHLRQAVSTMYQRKASLKDKEGNEYGYKSMITGIVSDKASKVRGDRTELLIYEEAGSDPILQKKWVQGEALIVVGGTRIGMRIAYGTGGDESKQAADLERMFYSPRANNILPYKHNYTTDGQYVTTGYFIPAFNVVIQDGIMDKRGVCIEHLAKEHYMKQRELKSGDPNAYLLYCAEYCFTPDEALSRKGDNIFDQALLAARKTEVDILKLGIKPKYGVVESSSGSDGSLTAKVRFVESSLGKVRIYEEPRCDEEGNPFRNLYVAGIDSIDQGVDQSTGQRDVSDYCLVVKRRQFGLEPPKYVCIYKDRPQNIKSAYLQTINILKYYNCQAVVESSRTAIVNFFKDHKCQYLLMKRPQSMSVSDKYVNNNMYGVYPSKNTIEYYLELISDFVLENCNTIDDSEMLKELMEYSFENKRKFDIVASLGMCEIGDQEMRSWGKIQSALSKRKVKQFGWYYDEKGIKHYGVKPSPEQTFEDIQHLIQSNDPTISFENRTPLNRAGDKKYIPRRIREELRREAESRGQTGWDPTQTLFNSK